ncbi:MAG: PKD domain-containing protein, partial [Methanobacterium sp.]
MRAASKIIFLGFVFIFLIFTCSNLPCFTDTYASFSDTKHTSDNIILDVWDHPANLIGLSYLNKTKNIENFNGTDANAVGDQSSVFTYKSSLAENSSDSVNSSVSSISSSVSNISSTDNLMNNSIKTENETIKLNNTVKLTEASKNGMDFSTDPSSRSTTVTSEKHEEILPTANFSSITEGYAPLTVQFSDLSENVTKWNWDFGDGDTSSEQNPVHIYYKAGTYNANLIAINENGTSSKVTKITVYEQSAEVLPTANFSSNITEGFAPLTIQFTDLSENSTEINWEFGDGTTAKEQNPVHIYSTAGIYNSKLVATNENGTNSKVAVITVHEQPAGVLPVANFSSNITEGYVPLTVQFTDLSENATGWNWDFGDGDTSSEQNPFHTYHLKGNYTVNLEVTNENGTNSKLAKINVLQPIMPVANFSSNVTEGYAPLTVQFTDLSENSTEINWD